MGYINPLLRLPEGRDLVNLPVDSRRALVAVLRALRARANAEAEIAWARRKGPMAAYWRAVATYARHIAHALQSGQPEPRAAVTDDEVISACEAHGIALPVEALDATTALVNLFGADARPFIPQPQKSVRG